MNTTWRREITKEKDGCERRLTDTESKGHCNEMRTFGGGVVLNEWGILYMRLGQSLRSTTTKERTCRLKLYRKLLRSQ